MTTSKLMERFIAMLRKASDAPEHRTVVVVFFVVFVIAVGVIASMEIACPLLSLVVFCFVLVTST